MQGSLVQGSVYILVGCSLHPGGAQAAGPGAHCLLAPAPAHLLHLANYLGVCEDMAGCPASCAKL